MSPGDYDEDGNPVWSPNLQGTSGAAHSVSSDLEGEDSVRRLRKVVAEITNGRIPEPVRRGPGFL